MLRITFTVFLKLKLIISQIMENDEIMIACAKIILIEKPGTKQPRPQGAFPWLPPPKPGKSALGTRLGTKLIFLIG